MLTESEARLILFSCIEPADNFWSGEIFQTSALAVLERVINGKYYGKRPEFLDLQQKISMTDLPSLRKELIDSGCTFLTPEDLDWPSGLNDLLSPPIGLVIKGDRSTLKNLDKSISIVGSRKPTSYGYQIAKSLAMQAVKQELIVVSGGAYGIDTASHIGALAGDGKTICILAGGLNNLYPLENSKLFSKKFNKI